MWHSSVRHHENTAWVRASHCNCWRFGWRELGQQVGRRLQPSQPLQPPWFPNRGLPDSWAA